jgi:perosamine synthetase
MELNTPSVTQREIEYAAEAVSSGRGAKATAAVLAFQRNMARCVGRKYAFAVSGVRAAFFLALRAMGIGPGDEVLIPEGADFAAAAAVLHCGATPVFCDLDPATFTLDPKSAAARTGPRTRCIIAAHMYGLPCDMQTLEELAGKSGLFLIEDASSGFGGLRQGRAVGSFGDISVFNFKDTSLVHTGEGGMLLSSSRDLVGRAARLGGEGRSVANPLVYDIAAHDFAMSNLAAAVGLAQLERLKELVEQKARIFNRYRERLGDVPGLALNPEIAETRNSFLMPFIVLEQGGAGDLAKRLWAGKIASRPALTPLSSMPLFKKADNPVAHGAADRLLLLPGGFDLTDDEVDYAAACVKMLLRDPELKKAEPAPSGWLKYRAGLLDFFARIKKEGCVLPFTHNKRNYSLSLMTPGQTDDTQLAAALGELRLANAHMFTHSPANVEEEFRSIMNFYKSPAGAGFLLFLIREEGAENAPLLGHIGLSSFDFKKAECDAEGPLLSASAPAGLAAAAGDALYLWCKSALHLTRVFARVRGSDEKSMRLSTSLGFVPMHRISLRRQTLPGAEILRPMYIPGHDKPDDFMVIAAKDL